MIDDDLPPLPATPPGLYRHYKGTLYQVIDTVRHSETLEPMTLYRALYGRRELWVRPAAMFEEHVSIDGAMPPVLNGARPVRRQPEASTHMVWASRAEDAGRCAMPRPTALASRVLQTTRQAALKLGMCLVGAAER